MGRHRQACFVLWSNLFALSANIPEWKEAQPCFYFILGLQRLLWKLCLLLRSSEWTQQYQMTTFTQMIFICPWYGIWRTAWYVIVCSITVSLSFLKFKEKYHPDNHDFKALLNVSIVNFSPIVICIKKNRQNYELVILG